jgi:hypothetical protein
MIRFARFRRGDYLDPTALETEGLHYRITESGLRNKYGLFFILSLKKPYFDPLALPSPFGGRIAM